MRAALLFVGILLCLVSIGLGVAYVLGEIWGDEKDK